MGQRSAGARQASALAGDSLENVSSPTITKSECFLLRFQDKDTGNEGYLENVGSMSSEITQMSAEANF